MQKRDLREYQQDLLLRGFWLKVVVLVRESGGSQHDFSERIISYVFYILATVQESGIDEAMDDLKHLDDSRLCAVFYSFLGEIKEFMRTPEEGAFLVCKVAHKAFGQVADYYMKGFGEQVQEQTKLYNGLATDQAPEDEVADAYKKGAELKLREEAEEGLTGL
ncbi:hypothetical protein A2Z53_02865 [Candidatus Giovannonibacteria bacterium RIFCSPHIGHO2_02_42_15]|uniref:Uncharacterized protein n=2 Tax=Candidatus Giovannoniibacteriota TaxID=1752738 RepID=A0A1F5VQE1_9BACT|nr:MAG: hypothetical protein UV11_C0016G0028 [Candidatus Giovannonibacteria bacterium GW2011_GWF2_42_19]OGF65281.1 MAG: hypothetical protein A2Z53_02865 [Candidatus Giovannonibacteria bacterium RIFCSPHIGHO2_02_42_15]